MQIGVLKEIKTEENRVSMTPSGVEILARAGHRVMIEQSAGLGSGFTDELRALRAGFDLPLVVDIGDELVVGAGPQGMLPL